MIGNEEDFTASRGFEIEGVDENLSALASDSFAVMIAKAAAAYPNFKVIATTMRTVHTVSINDWSAIAWSPDTGLVQATHRPRLEILDRVGGGDSFASGLIYGLLTGQPLPPQSSTAPHTASGSSTTSESPSPTSTR
jgi:2-dehydro-3-deoxygluconokinase